MQRLPTGGSWDCPCSRSSWRQSLPRYRYNNLDHERGKTGVRIREESGRTEKRARGVYCVFWRDFGWVTEGCRVWGQRPPHLQAGVDGCGMSHWPPLCMEELLWDHLPAVSPSLSQYHHMLVFTFKSIPLGGNRHLFSQMGVNSVVLRQCVFPVHKYLSFYTDELDYKYSSRETIWEQTSEKRENHSLMSRCVLTNNQL